ncbi:MAG: electron transfer flavoprotein-ubiquinone oxidoreductase [Burkholderiaceae bacterium]|nr:electron transfer flavoprotein-ubiquinone oxidoreductase [Burkholderiaceae bacterium]
MAGSDGFLFFAIMSHNQNLGPREAMEYDLVIVGGGPAGLAAAIRAKQLAAQNGNEVSVCVLEKGSELGAHTLSGAIIDPKSLAELFPDWRERGAPLNLPVASEQMLQLSASGAKALPAMLVPACFHNDGNYLISLGNLVRWLGQQAEGLGVDIFPGFAAAEVLYRDDGSVMGVATGDMGLDRERKPKPEFQRGMELHAKYTIFAEGTRGQLGRELMARFALDKGRDPQAYSIGIKEVWEVSKEQHRPGLVVHTAGWPLDNATYGGSFIYHMENRQVAIGYIFGLDYRNPYLSPFEEFQRFKTHPAVRTHIEGGQRIAYGARALTAGGLQALPELTFPGGALAGCEAGFMNGSRLKGIHGAIKSGALAAEAAVEALAAGRANDVLAAYPQAFRQSWLHEELHRGRNFKPCMEKGLMLGGLLFGIDQVLLRGRAPWTMHRKHADHATLLPAAQCQPIAYPKPDGRLTFDLLSSVYLTGVQHEEDQPCHLTLKDADKPVALNLAKYAGPEARYCPAGVYEFVQADDGLDRLQINASNCIHCKTCDIKDPTQTIVWIAPEGGGGPNYSGM